MPLDPVTGGIIGAGINTFGNLMGGKQQAKAINKATATADRFNREALDWEKSEVRAEHDRLQPYREMGGQAYQQLGRMLGVQQPPGLHNADGRGEVGGMPVGSGSFSFAQPMRPAAPSMVQIQGPDGRVLTVPAHKRDYYVAKGGRLVSGGMPPAMEARA